MTQLIASNQLTLTNINDGQSSYTHTAYAYSADGTDRFTTVYPNLNLERNTGKLVDKSNSLLWGQAGPATATMTYDTLTIPETLKVIDAVRITQTTSGQSGWRSPWGSNGGSYSVTPNGKVSVSAYVRNNTSNTISINLQFAVSDNINQTSPKHLINSLDVPSDGKVHLITSTFVVPTGYSYGWDYIYSPQGTINTDFTFGLLKVELGSTATPWMPSGSEVTTADYPSYIGTYSDTNVDGSTDPSKYTWTVFKGSDGRGLSNVAQKWLVQSSSTKPSYAWDDSRWQTTLPVMSATNKYLYTIERTTYTDTTTSDVITLSAIYGDKGEPGEQGNPGTPGAPGAPGQNGADSWTVVMSNENVTLPANAQGGVTSYANSDTSISVMYGTGTAFTPVLSSETLANNQFKVSASSSNITAGTQTVDTTNKKINYAVASGMNATSGAVASITYTISIRNSAGVTSTVTKIQNFSKAEKGITGDKGIDSYTYIRYSASSNGASMTNFPGADSQYIGTCTTTQSTAPTAAGSYVWAKFVGEDGAKGDPTGITRSTTEPATRYTGMLWQYTGTDNLVVTGITALPSSLYVWTGSAWQLYLVKSTNLQVDNGFITNAMIGDATIESAKIKSIDAGIINANSLEALSAKIGKISNEFTAPMAGGTAKGSITIDSDIQVLTEIDSNPNLPTTEVALSTNSNFTGLMVKYVPVKGNAGHQIGYYTQSGVYLQDSINGWGGTITAENVTLSSWKNLILQSGYTYGDGVQPQYRRIKNLDGSYSVQFRGAVSPTSGNFPTSQVHVGTLSGVYVPQTTTMRQGSDNTGKGGRVAITTAGNLHILAPNTSSYVYIDALTYIN